MNRLAIRIAESLGLHRDGELLGLSLFESEIRRRIWWHFISRDGRAGEDYGLENTNSLLHKSNVRIPLNVDDADLYPEMKELASEKVGWTSMTFSLINIDLLQSLHKLTSFAKSNSPSSLSSRDARTKIIDETRAQIEKRMEYCNPIIPQHRLTIPCARALLRKLDFVTRQQWLSLYQPDCRNEMFTEENLVEALNILAPRLVPEDALLKPFAWVRKAYPQNYIMLYVLMHLCDKPEGPNVVRA